MLRSNLVLKPGGLLLFCSCMLFVPILMRLSQRLVESLRNQALSTKGILPMPCICTHGIRHFYNALSIGNILTEGDRINAHSFTHYELQPAFSKTSPIRTMASVIQSPVCLPTHKVWTFHDSYVGPALTERLTLSIRSRAPAGNPTSKTSGSVQTKQHVPGKHREQQKPIPNPTFNKLLYIRQATHLEDVSPIGSIIISCRVGVVGNLSCASSNARFQSLECTVDKREETI